MNEQILNLIFQEMMRNLVMGLMQGQGQGQGQLAMPQTQTGGAPQIKVPEMKPGQGQRQDDVVRTPVMPNPGQIMKPIDIKLPTPPQSQPHNPVNVNTPKPYLPYVPGDKNRVGFDQPYAPYSGNNKDLSQFGA